MSEINPFGDEQISIVEEIRAELESLKRREAYLEELLGYYDSSLPTDIQAA